MEGIPPAKDTDAEDVVWGLQTADALWKRGERIDALVWLRRAAQAAGDASDDDRALELARMAAELTEWMANQPQVLTVIPEAADGAPNPPSSQSIEIDVGATESARQLPSFPLADSIPPPPAERPLPPQSTPPSQPTMQTAEPDFTPAPQTVPREATEPVEPVIPVATESRDDVESVLPAEKVHAGMFDPWAEQAAGMPKGADAPPPPPEPVVAAPPKLHDDAEEEVITSVRPHALAAQRSDAPAPPSVPAEIMVARSDAPPKTTSSAPTKPPTPPRKPPPLPPRALQKPPVPKAPQAPRPPQPPRPLSPPPPAPAPGEHVEAAAPPLASLATPVPQRSADSTQEVAVPAITPAAFRSDLPEAPPPVPPPPSEPPPPPPPAPIAETNGALALDGVDAFGDLPDDAREAFARAAKVSIVAEGDEVSSFALAYIVNGSFDVAATVVDAPAVRLGDGAVLRARGTTEEGVPMRLICAEGSGRVATWSNADVEQAFRTCPWVEEDLRTAADRVQTLVGITIGPLGERLDASIREQIMSRLTLRPLGPSEIVVNAGEAVPGLLLVGVGELELVQGEKVSGTVGSGEFLFPTEVLGAGAAPATARAGAGGALIMFGDRKIAQELLVTCPPLLEVFAGM